MFSLTSHASSLGIIDFEEDLIWEMKQKRDTMKRIRSDLLLPSLKRQDTSTVIRFQKETLCQRMATMIPNQVITNISNLASETLTGCLISGKILGITELVEFNEKNGKSAYQITRTLNTFLSTVIEEAMSFEGDILNFSADSFLILFKSTSLLLLKYYVHAAINCALVIQKKFGNFIADGIILKVKLAISAGPLVFAILCQSENCCYVFFGAPVNEIETMEKISISGDIIVAPSAWTHVNPSEYSYLETEDLQYHKILGVGLHWKCAGREHLRGRNSIVQAKDLSSRTLLFDDIGKDSELNFLHSQEDCYLRPILLTVKDAEDKIAKFLIPPVVTTLNAQEPFDSLIETRQMVVMHVNVKMVKADADNLDLLNQYYKVICNKATEHKGLVTRCTITHDNIVFTVIFGLRGFTSVIESQEALKCAVRCRHEINLYDEVENVSVSCTTGKSYCGVLGHSLRREYVIISRCMFKSYWMVKAYTGKVTCDRQTFIYSNLEAENFTLLDHEQFEGLSDQGPLYEYMEQEGSQVLSQVGFESFPILGRDEEIEAFLKFFKIYLQNFGIRPCCNEPKCTFKNCIIIEGTYKQGKSKFLQELSTRVENVDIQRINFYENDRMRSYNAVRLVLSSNLDLQPFSSEYSRRKTLMNVIGESVSKELIYVLNEVFDVDFTSMEENPLREMKLRKDYIKVLCKKCFKKPALIMLEHAEYMDPESLTLLLAMLETKRFFLIISVDETRNKLSHLDVISKSHHVEKFSLRKIPKRYLAGLACQFLGVYAIPADLEKIIQSNSKGNPGWIQNFLLILQQMNKIIVTEVDFQSVHDKGLVAPPLYMLRKMSPESIEHYKTLLEEKSKSNYQVTDPWSVYIDSCREAFENVTVRSGIQNVFFEETKVPVCLLTAPLNPEIDVDPDVTDDLNFLDKYDRLSYDEQLVLRCASVLGDPFTRRLLFFIWMPNSDLDAAEVLVKLFDKEVLCCAGGDFSSGGDYILLRDKRLDPSAARNVVCKCIGLDIHDTCLFMPKYASCGFMRFKSDDFCRTVYELIPEEDRMELHSRAAKFIHKETRRCVACGCGYFPSRSGCKMANDPMGRSKREFEKKKKAPQLEQMDFDALFDYSIHASGISNMINPMERSGHRSALSGNIKVVKSYTTITSSEEQFVDFSYDDRHAKETRWMNPLTVYKLRRHASLVRTFSKSDFLSCDCHLILNHMYMQLKRHYAGSEQWHDMIITSIYYVKICMTNQNYAACMNTIKECLDILENEANILKDAEWKVKMLIAKFQGLKGHVLFDMDEVTEAYRSYQKALKTFGLRLPTNDKSLRFNWKLYYQKWSNKLRLFFSPSSYLNEDIDMTQLYIANSIAEILTNICKILMDKGKWKFAELAAQLSLKNSLQTETNLIRICEGFSHMLVIAQHYNRRMLWIGLEVHALRYCHKKRNFVESPELKAVSSLYLVIFEARMSRVEYESALQLGYIAISIATKCSNIAISIQLFTLISVILLQQLAINDSTSILRELEYFADVIDNNSGRSWYYSLTVLFHLETGYIMCPFSRVEMYFQAEDLIRHQKHYEAKIRLIVIMWVWYLRNKRWEEASRFKNEVHKYQEYKINSNNHAISQLYLLEGTLLTWVDRIDRRSISGMIQGKKTVQKLIKKLREAATTRTFITAKLYLLEAYYAYILENEDKKKKLLNKARKFCLKYGNKLVLLHVEHLEKAWNNELTSAMRDFWINHCKTDTYISYHEMELDNLKIYCYTYPKPRFRI